MRDRAWIRLLSYCVAVAIVGSLAIALLFAGATLAFGFGRAPASPPQDSPSATTVSGVISDSRCGPRHSTDAHKSPAECARLCSRRGAQYVVVNGHTTYLLTGSRVSFDAFAGQRTQLSGTLEGNTLKVASIRAQ
jgi:hypothetical protein